MLLYHTLCFPEQRIDSQCDCRWRGWCSGGVGGGAPLHLSASMQSILGSPPAAPLPPELVPAAQRALAWEVAKKKKEEEWWARPDQLPSALPHMATILIHSLATEEGVEMHRSYLLAVRTPLDFIRLVFLPTTPITHHLPLALVTDAAREGRRAEGAA